MSTALQRSKELHVRTGSIECARCDAGWYQMIWYNPNRNYFPIELEPRWKCTICGYMETAETSYLRWDLPLILKSFDA